MCDENTKRRADDVAHQRHQNTDGNERAGVCPRKHRRGCRAANVRKRSDARGEHIELEQTCEEEHKCEVNAEYNEARQNPIRCIAEFEQGCTRGEECNDGVEQDIRHLR